MKMLRDLRACFFDRHALRSYSQEGEDMILRRLFEGRREGFYVDVGAHHPMRFSNTYFFYRQGWRGLNIEPNPDAALGFRLFRHRDIHVQAGADIIAGEMRYWCFDEPALNTFDEALMRERISRTPYRVIETRMVTVDRLESILGQFLPANQKIDFISIDVEGGDLQVLQSNDWARFRPALVLVEVLGWRLDLADKHPIDEFMRGVGYAMVAKTHNTLFYGMKA
ncbi:MAG: FkbM family methyltransferase [Betaproteobacteria bacterium]